MNIDDLIQAAPDETNCVTVVSSVLSKQPNAIISQFMEDRNGVWQATREPIILPASQLPELIAQLEGVISATNSGGSSQA